ncbi:MAG: hypothetical protein NC924_02030 [Candidatus Omnitrophica bacterium]|nr:hypothetical protein [Candidatus Omnitrophota bacterium]
MRQNLSWLEKDYLLSNIRGYLSSLQSVLFTLENSERFERQYVDDSLRSVETAIRHLRRMRLVG